MPKARIDYPKSMKTENFGEDTDMADATQSLSQAEDKLHHKYQLS